MNTRKISILLAVTALALSSLACSINVNLPQMKSGETTTMEVKEPAPSGEAQVSINMGAGNLNIKGGTKELVEGTIRTNVDEWKPSVTRNDDRVEITQKGEWKGLPPRNIVNEWELKLGGTATDLRIAAGAYRGNLELGGVPLTRLEIEDGASTVDVNFGEPNPEKMSMFQYHSGASTISLKNLANANFDEMIFEAGAGTYTLDFSGTLKRDGQVRISGGVSSTKIIIPKGTAAEVTVNGAVNNISTNGTWTVQGKSYSTEGSGAKLEITVDMGVGNLELIQK